MLRTTLKSSPNCWNVDAAPSYLDAMPRKSPCALSSSSATHCAVRTPESGGHLDLGKYFGRGKHVCHTHGLVSGSRFCALALAKRWPALTARQLLNSPNTRYHVPSQFSEVTAGHEMNDDFFSEEDCPLCCYVLVGNMPHRHSRTTGDKRIFATAYSSERNSVRL
jgi:hypothetical protein